MGIQSASAHPSVPARPLGMEASVPRARGARSRARAVAASVLVGLVLWRPLPACAGGAARRPRVVLPGRNWPPTSGENVDWAPPSRRGEAQAQAGGWTVREEALAPRDDAQAPRWSALFTARNAFALGEPDLWASTSINFRTPQKIKSCSGTLSIVLRLKNKPGKAPDGYHGAASARSSARNFTLKPSGKQVNLLEKPALYI